MLGNKLVNIEKNMQLTCLKNLCMWHHINKISNYLSRLLMSIQEFGPMSVKVMAINVTVPKLYGLWLWMIPATYDLEREISINTGKSCECLLYFKLKEDITMLGMLPPAFPIPSLSFLRNPIATQHTKCLICINLIPSPFPRT